MSDRCDTPVPRPTALFTPRPSRDRTNAFIVQLCACDVTDCTCGIHHRKVVRCLAYPKLNAYASAPGAENVTLTCLVRI